MAMTDEFVAGHRSRGRFLKGCAVNLSELPQPQINGGGGENAAGDGVAHEFDWALFDRVEGIDFFNGPVWQPWM